MLHQPRTIAVSSNQGGGGSDIKREEDNTRAEVCSLAPCAEKNMPDVSNGDVSNGDRKGNRQGKLLYGRGCA